MIQGEKLKLIIDSSQNTKTKVCVDATCVEKHYDKPNQQKILEVIHETLKKTNTKLENIDCLEINTGPGSFTSLRAGLAIANTIAWALGIKVNGKKSVDPDYTYNK